MLSPGTRLGPYEIVAPIGAGGMGEVYRARDTRLGRDVAIKVLPPEFADDPERLRRFEQEARAVAALSHPNVLALFDVGSAVVSLRGAEGPEAISAQTSGLPRPPSGLAVTEGEPVHFLITELLEGESLRDRLKAGGLTVRKAVEDAVQIAQGLAAAHEKGIIHRDLKPANVFITKDGQVKILDFGIAKLAPPRSVEELEKATTVVEATAAGDVFGTVGYMPPEQIRGQSVDQRSDIFSFGCVVYEMLSGRRAFEKATAADTMSVILSKDPVPLSSLERDVSPTLEGIVNRCLEKRPEDRFSSAHDLALALELISDVAKAPVLLSSAAAAKGGRGWRGRRRLVIGGAVVAVMILALVGALRRWHGRAATTAGGLNPTRVIVLAFENVTGDRSLDPLGRLAGDWISQGLMQTEKVEVVPGAAAVGQTEPVAIAGDALRTLAAKVGAGTIIAGAYYKTGENLEMQGRLTDSNSGKVLYAVEPVRCPRTAPMECVDRIRQRLMGAVVTQFGVPEFTSVIQKPPLYEAYIEYMAGFEAHGIDMAKALVHLERAVKLDPDFMIAQIRLASAYANASDWVKAEALLAKLRTSAERMTPAEKLFLDLIDAMYHGRLVETYQAAKNLHALVPGDSVITFQVAQMALLTGRPREALATLGDVTPILAQFGRFRQMSWWVTNATSAHHILGEHEAELTVARKGLQTFPDMLSMHAAVVRALAALGRMDELNQALDAALGVPSGARTPGDVMLDAVDELQAHGHRDASLRLAKRAVDWYRSQPAEQLKHEAIALGLVRAFCAAGQWDEARSVADKVVVAVPDSISAKGRLGVIVAHVGDRARAGNIAKWLEKAQDLDDPGLPVLWRARIAAQMGDEDQAIALLREAFRQGQSLILTTHADPDLDPIAKDPAFQKLVQPQG